MVIDSGFLLFFRIPIHLPVKMFLNRKGMVGRLLCTNAASCAALIWAHVWLSQESLAVELS